MAYQPFNFGKRLGLVGKEASNPIRSGLTGDVRNDDSPFVSNMGEATTDNDRRWTQNLDITKFFRNGADTFNMGKRLGLVGSNPETQGAQSSPTAPVEMSPLVQPGTHISSDVRTVVLSPGASKQLQGISGRIVFEFPRDPCDGFYEIASMEPLNNPLDPSGRDNPGEDGFIIRFGCGRPSLASGGGNIERGGLVGYNPGTHGGGSSGASDEDKEKTWRNNFPDEPLDEWHWAMHDTYRNGPVPTCSIIRRTAIRNTMKQIFNELNIDRRFPDLYECMKAGLSKIKFHCWEGLVVDWFSHEDYKLFIENHVIRIGTADDITIDKLLRYLLLLCPGVGSERTTIFGSGVIANFILQDIQPDCQTLTSYAQHVGSDYGGVEDRLFDWDFRTGLVYRLNLDGSRGKVVEDWNFKCRIENGKWNCCP